MSDEINDKNNDKQHLLALIAGQGILHESAQNPLVARDGRTQLSWVMNFLGISLQAEPLRLAAQQMLGLLRDFEGRQLATIGTAAVPLLSACLLESGGKYNGLMVRPKRKAYGTASLIDGRINHAEPVIVIDDSIGSGGSMLDCISKLEAAGLYVEGCACLVRFGYDSGYAKLVERGYRVAYLFDNAKDLARWHPADWQYNPYPLKHSFQQIVWDEQQLPAFISPFRAIRESIEHFWQSGKLLRPPPQFNQPVDTSGGVWLSLRLQDAMYTSQGRQGFWHFPDGNNVSAPELDVSHVAWLMAHALRDDPQRTQRLQQGGLALSLFGELEACLPGDLDNQQYGIALRSSESPWKMGGALPNMPGISSTAHQLHHARYQNTKLFTHEPCHLYRHTVTKLIEPGAEWPYGGGGRPGQRWDEQQESIAPLAQDLLQAVRHGRQWGELPAIKNHYIPPQCCWLFLAVYHAGRQLACMGIKPQQANALPTLLELVLKDERWQGSYPPSDTNGHSANEHRADELYIKLSVLTEETLLGCNERLEALPNFVLGQDAIAVQSAQQFALMLPEVPLEQHWTIAQLNDALYQKAGIAQQEQNVYWYRLRTRSWHADTASVRLLRPENRLAQPDSMAEPHQLIIACESFIRQQCHQDGQINSHYHPNLHQAVQQEVLFTTASVLWLMHSGGISGDTENHSEQSYDFVAQALANPYISQTERAYAVLALLTHPEPAGYRALIARQLEMLQASFNRHGQLSRPETGSVEWLSGHYGIELYVLLRLLQEGFSLDQLLLQTAVQQLLRYVERQASPCQFPMLLQTLALAKHLMQRGVLEVQESRLLAGIDRLVQGLLQWQQPKGAFMPENPALSPVMFSVRAMHALLDADMLIGEALQSGLAYLRCHLIQPEQARYFPRPDYAVGAVYSGLYDGSVSVLLSAQLLQLLRRTTGQNGQFMNDTAE